MAGSHRKHGQKTKSCWVCTQEIERRSRYCPHCGAKQRRFSGWGVVCTVTLFCAAYLLQRTLGA